MLEPIPADKQATTCNKGMKKQKIYTDLTLYRAIAKVYDASYRLSKEERREVVADEWDWPMPSEPAELYLPPSEG